MLGIALNMPLEKVFDLAIQMTLEHFLNHRSNKQNSKCTAKLIAASESNYFHQYYLPL